MAVVVVMPNERCGSTTEQSEELICHYEDVQGRQMPLRDNARTLSAVKSVTGCRDGSGRRGRDTSASWETGTVDRRGARRHGRNVGR